MRNNKVAKLLGVIVLSAILFSSCATKKKYGCPTHIIERIVNLF
ncbi:MAG: hypothetical protein ORN55_02675 [Chitinophagaceae bacterium]|nr:hypothetical protein [Chitinophagaceae bacterium]